MNLACSVHPDGAIVQFLRPVRWKATDDPDYRPCASQSGNTRPCAEMIVQLWKNFTFAINCDQYKIYRRYEVKLQQNAQGRKL